MANSTIIVNPVLRTVSAYRNNSDGSARITRLNEKRERISAASQSRLSHLSLHYVTYLGWGSTQIGPETIREWAQILQQTEKGG